MPSSALTLELSSFRDLAPSSWRSISSTSTGASGESGSSSPRGCTWSLAAVRGVTPTLTLARATRLGVRPTVDLGVGSPTRLALGSSLR